MAKKSSKYKPEMLLYHDSDPNVIIKLLHPMVEGSDLWVCVYMTPALGAHLGRLYYKREVGLDWNWTTIVVDNDKEEEWV